MIPQHYLWLFWLISCHTPQTWVHADFCTFIDFPLARSVIERLSGILSVSVHHSIANLPCRFCFIIWLPKPAWMYAYMLSCHAHVASNCFSSLFVQFTSWGPYVCGQPWCDTLGIFAVKPWAFLLCLQLFFCLNMVFQNCFASTAARQCWFFASSWPSISYDHVEFGVN